MARSIAALAVFLLVFFEKVRACDVCGCSVGGTDLGLMAVYRQCFVGFQYQHLSFSSTLRTTMARRHGFPATFFSCIVPMRKWRRKAGWQLH